MPDAHKNFAISTVATAPSPAASGTSLVVSSGTGTLFPAVPFNATVWPAGAQPLSTNAEIVRVTNISTDTFTITRTQEGTSARTIVVGDQIAATITAKTLTDIESNYIGSWSPYIPTSGGTGVQSLANSSGSSSTGSLYVFPVTLQYPVKFNQIIVPNQLSYVLSATTTTASNSYYSSYGIYSMVSNSLLTLISSNSFSIGESLTQSSTNAVTLSWNYPTSTATSGYGYGNFPAGTIGSGGISSYLSGTRAVGLQFGGEVSLSGGQYWIGLMSQRSTAGQSTYGLSHVGIVGQIINPINMVGTVSGGMPIGVAPAEWAQKNTHITGWWGRHIAGFITATSTPNFGGTRIPNNISIFHLGAAAANSTGTILPTVSFVST